MTHWRAHDALENVSVHCSPHFVCTDDTADLQQRMERGMLGEEELVRVLRAVQQFPLPMHPLHSPLLRSSKTL